MAAKKKPADKVRRGGNINARIQNSKREHNKRKTMEKIASQDDVLASLFGGSMGKPQAEPEVIKKTTKKASAAKPQEKAHELKTIKRVIIGTCPVCGAGVEKAKSGWECSADKKVCRFNVPQECFGHSITAKDAKVLINGDIIGPFDDVISEDGTTVSASIQVQNGKVVAIPSPPEEPSDDSREEQTQDTDEPEDKEDDKDDSGEYREPPATMVVPSLSKLEVPDDIASFLTIKDVSNFNFARYYLTEDVENIISDIMQMQNVGDNMRKMKLKYLNGMLMHGVPGTGKTHTAQYIAYALGYPFAFLNFATLLDGGIFGATARNINKIFRFMQDKVCVFMLDEIDCIAIKRGEESAATGGELSRITITLMQELDNYADNGSECILLAATNRLDTMDPALLSRFPIKHEMKPLGNADREGYIRKFLDDVGVDYDPKNINEYVHEHTTVRQRNIESDMTRCIIRWVENDRQGFVLDHIES